MANVSLPMKEIANVEIPLPPLEVQQEFVETFQTLESDRDQILIELNHQLALVKELRQAYLREAMQGKLVRQDERDEPAGILLEKIKAEKKKLAAEKKIKRDKPLPPIKPEEIPFAIPSSWTWCRLDDLCDFTNGKAHEQYVSDSGQYILINSRFVSTSGKTVKHSSELLTPLLRGDIAMVMSDVPTGIALGRCYLVKRNNTYTLNQRIGGITPLSGVDSTYLTFTLDRNQHFLNFDDGKK